MPRHDTLAAVDLGSNSFHLVVSREQGADLQVLDRLREPVRIAAGLDGEPVASVEGLWRALTAGRIGRRLPLVVSRRLTKRTLQLTPDERR